jgi:hypothetical protein
MLRQRRRIPLYISKERKWAETLTLMLKKGNTDFG